MAKATLPELRRELRDRLTRPLPDRTWSGPPHMARVADRIAALFDGAVPEPVDPERLAEAVARLTRDDDLTAAEIRLCCAGATTPVVIDATSRAIVDSGALTERLLGLAEAAAGQLRMWRRCAFGLAHALLLPVRPPQDAAAANSRRLWDFVVPYARRPT